MKIDTDLRLAIRSAYNAQRNSNRVPDWKRSCNAAEEFKKLPLGREVKRKACRLHRRADKLREAAHAIYKTVGLNSDGSAVADEAVFKKAGGKISPKGPALWNFDAVVAEIAAATPQEGQAIIKRLGINWK